MVVLLTTQVLCHVMCHRVTACSDPRLRCLHLKEQGVQENLITSEDKGLYSFDTPENICHAASHPRRLESSTHTCL